ncbi:hypothetical protein MRX96_011106 [Rhipicephalus microplus]
MGVSDLFSAKCNLSGMFKSGSPVGSNMVHKVYLRVDEDGTGPCGIHARDGDDIFASDNDDDSEDGLRRRPSCSCCSC